MPLWARCGVATLPSGDSEDRAEDSPGADNNAAVGGAGAGGGAFEGIVRNVASLLSDTILGYFRSPQKTPPPLSTPGTISDRSDVGVQEEIYIEEPLTTAPSSLTSSTASSDTVTPSTPCAEVSCGDGVVVVQSGDDVGQEVEIVVEEDGHKAVDDLDEVLSSTLGALYGRATPAAVKQAWEVLTDSYGNDVSKFKDEFLNPVLELLHKVQEIQDTSECPNSTWPLSVGSCVVVHLTQRNRRYLRDIGDFCISAVLHPVTHQPCIVVSDLTFDGIAERRVHETEYSSLLTMDWARKVREAPDHELVFVLRQCMVASEYTVRHLRWDEIPQLDPRNLRSSRLQGDSSDLEHFVHPDAVLDANNSGVKHSAGGTYPPDLVFVDSGQRARPGEILHLSGPTAGEESSTDGDVSAVDRPHVSKSPALSRHQTFHHTTPRPPRTPSQHQDSGDQSQICSRHEGTAQIGTTDPDTSPLSPSSQTSSLSSPAHRSEQPSTSHLSSTLAEPSSSPSHSSSTTTSPCPGTNYYPTWHGASKASPLRRSKDHASGSKTKGLAADNGLNNQSRPGSGVSQGTTGEGSQTRDASPAGATPRSQMERSNSSSYLVRRQLTCPETVAQLDSDLLASGVAILPGCSDEDGRNLVYIFTCSSLWHERRVSSSELARLLMYYHTLPRRQSAGMAVVADIRGATPSTINTLLEALYLFQDNLPEPLSIIHLFADKTTQSYVIKSPLYDAKGSVNLKMVLSFDHLQQYISPDQIPTVLEGEFPYNHESWVRFRKKLEPFMSSCRSVACRLVEAMQEMASCELMPQSVSQASEMIQAHEQTFKLAFEDQRLLSLQSDGPAIISALRREQESFAHSEDYRFAMDQASELHQHLQDTIARLARLADTRMNKLHNCLQLREYEEECHKVIDWLSQEGGAILQRHDVTADNLRAVRHQQKDFEKFYYSAMSYIEKGNDLLEEASMLSQCGNFSEATGYKDLAKTLKRQLQIFTGQLEEARERIEGTAKCYHLLDKSYEWALEAMKYVSSMKMEHSSTAEGLDKLLRSLTIYLSEHQPIPEENFAAMLETAQRLRNEKLLEQCRVAKARCQETHQLLQLRQTSLRRARNQLEVEQALKVGEGGADQDSSQSKPSPSSPSVFDVHDMARPIDHISQDISTDHSSSHSSSFFSTPPSSHPSLANTSSNQVTCPGESSPRTSADSRAQCRLWQPQDSSTPTFANWQSNAASAQASRRVGFRSEFGSSHSLGLSTEVGGSSPQLQSPATEPSSPYSSASSNASPHPSPSKTPLTSSLSAPLPSSSSASSMILPVSPTLSVSDTPRSARPYQPSSSMSRLYNCSPTRTSPGSAVSSTAKLAYGRALSQPGQARNAHSLPAGASPGSRPHKKMLKRASTAPIPMLSSPILEEEPTAGLQAQGTEGDAADESGDGEGETREHRNAKSISMITGSSESLPSMPEEEEADLEMSPSREHSQVNSTNSSIRDWTPIPVNTHLHRSARGTPTGPMADLRLSEAEIKSRRTVSLIMSEMIQTERDYVRALQFIIDHYIPELQRDDVPQLLRGKRTVIFGNLEKIQQFHSQYFLKQLESCQNQPFLVGQYFLQHETMFYLYALYNKNKPKSDMLMMEYGKTFFRQKQLELGDKMDLSSYLLKPVQRMGKYALLLKQLLKECAETELEYPELKAAEEMVKFQLRHGNDLLAMDSLRDCDVNLQEQGRLLRQEEFLVFQGRKKSMRRIFLFEDLILFSKTRRGRQGQHDIYVYKACFKTADIGLTENFGDSGYKFEIWFRRRSVGENYVLQAPSSEVKKAWVKDISRLLWRQAIRNRESRINELATMGIGNKPCMDIKPSEDNIQDRSINVSALGNRGARTRNSIAVSSFDYLRNGNKRPHSIISVSSTSSSGSSQSSFGLLGSLNLAFDPLDSPRLNRRSFLSNESGIVTDSDTSGADPGSENRGPISRRTSPGNVAPLTTMRSYFDVMKSRVLKQKYSDQVYTDV